MSEEVDRLIGRLARDASRVMQPFVPSRAQPDARMALLDNEPSEVESAVSHNALFRETVEALARDEALRKIAPVGELGPVIVAATSQPRLSANDLVCICIGSAAAELRCHGRQPSADTLAEMSLRNLERLRGIAHGVPVRVPTYLGFAGLSLPGTRSLVLPWGELTAPVGWYRFEQLFETRATSCVLSVDHSLEIALEALAPQGPGQPSEMTIVVVHPRDVPKPIRSYHEWSVRTLLLVRLCIVLCTPSRRVAPVPTFQFTVLPYQTSTGAQGHIVLAPPATERTLSEDECAEIERLAPILEAHYSSRLEVVGRRIVAAVSHRLDPADRLIDAVTAWESLFSAPVDASFRVTAAIATLLEPNNAEKRGALQRELVKIYNLRSDVVHGRPADEVLVFSSSFAATEFAVEALAALLERHPDLVNHDPAERSRRLLLGLS